MINLIPPSAQSQVKKEYWIRVISVWLLLIGTAFFIVAILNAPVYVLIRSQLQSFLQEYNQANDESESFATSEATINKANEINTVLASSQSVTSFSTIIEELEKLTGPAVRITNFSLSRQEDAIATIVINGSADSRLSLSEFKDAIEESPLFETATLPLSNFAKDRDVPFSIDIVPSVIIEE